MQVVELNSYGTTDTLTVVQRPAPVPSAGQVLVTVAAATVNPVDLGTRAGAFAEVLGDVAFPLTLGWDFAGTLESGRRVAGMIPWFATRSGAYAEVIAVDPAWLAPVPDGLDDVSAAAVPLNALTARTAVHLAGVRPGQTVLITGASGGVGGYAVELAAAAGAHVLAVASTGDERYVAGLGAKDVLRRTGSAAELVDAVRAVLPGGADVVLDPAGVGGALIGAVRDGGVFTTPVPYAVPDAERDIRVRVVHVEPDAAALGRLLSDAADGRLTPRVAGTLPLADAAEAHTRTAAGGLRGKLVLVTGR
jgi:NADPH2:quinone reductase